MIFPSSKPQDLLTEHLLNHPFALGFVGVGIERKIGEYAKAKGCRYIKFVSPAQRAVPDRIIITPNGVIGFLELKRPGNKPTSLQIREIMSLRDHNCIAAWCDSVPEGTHFVNELLNKKNDWV